MKAGVFIDAGYLSHITKDTYNLVRLDFELFSNELCAECNRELTYYYTAMPHQSHPPTDDERVRYSRYRKFVSRLNRIENFRVRLGHLQKVDGKYQQKGVDTLFTVDLTQLCMRNRIEKAIIVSGDSDFTPAVEVANECGVETLNVIHLSQFSYHLRNTCNRYLIIDQDLIDKTKFQRQ